MRLAGSGWKAADFLLSGVGTLVVTWIMYRLGLRWRQRVLRQRDEQVFELMEQWTKSLQQEIAQRQQAQRALEESQKFIMQQERLAAVGQLASGLAHEFNNIMTILQGHATLLLEHPNLDDESRVSARQISNGVERTAKLVRQMLAFTRQQVMQAKSLDVRETLATTEEMLRQMLGDSVHLYFDIALGLPRIKADPTMFQQIVVNLVVNARDAMSSGGELTIAAQEANFSAGSLDHNSERKPGHYVKLSVSDTGRGMETAVIKRLFEPFFTTKDVGKGTGLGLATVHGMVQQHSGWVEVSSKVGKGTTFDLYFPVTHEAPEPVAPPAAPIVGGQETVLVCEDEEVLRELVETILTAQGYNVIEASNGAHALQQWEQHRGEIDLLLTDIAMPGGLTGTELAAKLRLENPHLPVIFSSGHTQTAAVTSHSEAETFYLSKPYRPAQLSQTVREALDSARHNQTADVAPAS